MEEYEERKLNDNKKKNKKRQISNIVPFYTKIFVLFHEINKQTVLDFELKLSNRNIEFINDLKKVKRSANKKFNILKQFDYLVVVLSSECLKDYLLMEVLADNFNISKNSRNKRIIPIIIEDGLYEPETRAEIISYWIDRNTKYKDKYFTGKFGDEVSKTLEKMQQIIDMLRIFLLFGIENDLKSDEDLASRILEKIEKYSGETYERRDVVVKNYKDCLFVKAKGHSIINATQNNGISKNELIEIIDLIEKNLDKLNQEQAEDLKDTLSMVVEEFSNETPRQGRLKKCLGLIEPIITVSNGIPVLAENLQKVCDYILPFIN